MPLNFRRRPFPIIASLLLAAALACANPIMQTADLDALWADHLLWRAEHDTVSPLDREATMRMALMIRPTDTELLRVLANAYKDTGDLVLHEAAQAFIDLLNSLASDSTIEVTAQREIVTRGESNQVKGVLETARSLFAEQRFDDAERALRSLLREAPDNEETINLLGQCYLIQSEYVMASLIYSLLRERHPNNADHINHLAYGLERVDQASWALTLLQHFADTVGYDPVTYGNILLLAGRLDERAVAERIINDWVQTDPDHPQAWTQHAHLHIYLNDLDTAQTSAVRARELAPAEPAPLHYLIEIALRRGDTVAARNYADRLRELLTSDVYDALVEQGRLPRVE